MLHLRRISSVGCRNPIFWDAFRAFSSTTDQSSIRKAAASILDTLSLKPGGTLVLNHGDSDVGKSLIQLAKERKLRSISIIDDKPGNPETIEELKALGGDIIVPVSYTKTWYMKRLVNELSPTAGIIFGEGYQATAVGKAVINGGTLISFGKKLPTHVIYDGSDRKSIEWDTFAKAKKIKVLNM